ncbi:nicotinate (nicotinamide) nucleotide adenylyltransferase [Hymenobacter guriensis]|uniref:nicotinate (nicotinamide) nucleotide adenylyltransferase n=1 Tax=Hymenobacter guriensis TaxID=2793065 RepID=UPI001E65B3AF|nr:nicotinate (nicotinamide) nucleotide adenylyltransferase [Hymenobacter guriensis]
MSKAKVGLLFGSFNPIHTGHLILAEFMATHTDLDAVWLVVSPQSPFKVGEELLPEAERYALVQAAIANNPRLRVLDIEFGMPKPNYTIHTLDTLRQQYPLQDFVLLMGGDNLPGLPRWKEASRIMAEYSIYVYPRPGTPIAEVTAQVRIVEAPLLDISATFIRGCVRAGRSIRYMVPAAVDELIKRNKYWQA